MDIYHAYCGLYLKHLSWLPGWRIWWHMYLLRFEIEWQYQGYTLEQQPHWLSAPVRG